MMPPLALALALVLALALPPCAAARPCARHTAPDMHVLHALDGDTVALEATGLPAPLDDQPLALRILGVDCPETGHRARCAAEEDRGRAATAFTRAQLAAAAGAVVVEICGWDKYGGRVLGDLEFPGRGRLSALLVDAGLAAEYGGRGPRTDWCATPTPTARR